LNSIREMDRLLEVIIDLLIEGMCIDRGLVFLKDDETSDLYLAKARNARRESLRDSEHISKSILHEAHTHGHPFVTANAVSDPRIANDESLQSASSGAVFCAPLKAHGRTVGVLYADHPRAVVSLNESVINFFAAFCNIAALAIDNAFVHRALT